MRIAFYVSNHGFGHIMRELPVIAHLLDTTTAHILLVTAQKHLDISWQYLVENTTLSKVQLHERVTMLAQNVDVGLIVKRGTLRIDTSATEAAVSNYVTAFPRLIALGEKQLQTYKIDRVVCDIVPWILTSAKNMQVPSYFMASFTWLEQYEGFLPERLLSSFRNCYADADHVLFYEYANQPTRTRFPAGVDIGFVARPFHEDKVQQIRTQFGTQKPIVFLSLGGSNSGLSEEMDVSQLPFQFITTEGLKLKGGNVTYLPVETDNTQDYVAASDYCISKAGWSTLSEMMLAGKPMALLERADVPEDVMYIAQEVKENAAISITVDDLQDMGSILERMQNTKWTHPVYTNGYACAAQEILR